MQPMSSKIEVGRNKVIITVSPFCKGVGACHPHPRLKGEKHLNIASSAWQSATTKHGSMVAEQSAAELFWDTLS